MERKERNEIDRREFLKRLGVGAAVSTVALTGCDPKNNAITGNHSAKGDVPTDQMTYRTHPKSGDRVSLLGYGCMRWPFRQKSDGNGEEIDQEAVNELVDYALTHGVNYFDTAPSYGRGMSEIATGIALKRHPRSSYYIATKMSNHHIVKEDLPPEVNYKNSIDLYRQSFERLQVDYIDYYLCHNVGGGSGIPFMNARFFDNGLMDFLLKEREAGRIRNLGFSFHGDVKVFDYMVQQSGVNWDFVQIQLNYTDWRNAEANKGFVKNVNAEYLYNELNKRGIAVTVMEPLLGGRLASLTSYLSGRLKQRRPDESIASWAFRFAGSFPGVLTVLSGMTYMEHLQDNIRTYSPLDPCTPEELELLENTAQEMLRYPSIPCTACEYCMPCPYGINIPGVFSHYNKCINEGNVPSSSQSENYREARRAFLIGYDRSVPRLRQANHCIGCDQCVHHCPQNIDIPAQMQRIDRFVEDLKQGREF